MNLENKIFFTFLPRFLLVVTCILFSQNVNASFEKETTFSKKDTISDANWIDGPHIEWLSNQTVNVVYYEYSSKRDKLLKKSRYIEIPNDEKLIQGKFGDRNVYFVEKNHKPPLYEYSGVDELIVIGDVHGEYDSLISLLKKSGIIDEHLDWKFGAGHLVFLGDIFDKGPKVTESLWFIKNLSYQADKAGGKLHIILGNHELMNLSNIYFYNTDKYERLSSGYPEEFKTLFSRNEELGLWIRSWNAILKIDDKLFVHGGISPQFKEAGMDEEEINTITRDFLNNEVQSEDTVKLKFLLSTLGPFMYRGYIMKEEDYELITEAEFEDILNEFDVNRIIFGHTELKYFHLFYDNRLMGIDVPLRFSGKSEQALYFTGDSVYKLYSDGSRVKLE